MNFGANDHCSCLSFAIYTWDDDPSPAVFASALALAKVALKWNLEKASARHLSVLGPWEPDGGLPQPPRILLHEPPKPGPTKPHPGLTEVMSIPIGGWPGFSGGDWGREDGTVTASGGSWGPRVKLALGIRGPPGGRPTGTCGGGGGGCCWDAGGGGGGGWGCGGGGCWEPA